MDDADPEDGDRVSDRGPTAAESACFEAGIKLGALYHQFAGTPISPASADDLARAIESAIANQPFCEGVTIDIDDEAVARATTEWGYTEFTGDFATVEVEIVTDETRVIARMADEDGYPRMRVERVEPV
ncbi:dihydroneopterin aldolase family protein [Halococcoides cellulosivorans]|uniref:Dihydroneopterin aldolase n=1 Tax=Halococcoides cellulosivorans TaxID=1679096 RepID=A0A2R4WXU9_9EURY|nr:dihydroneopterin aldolase family protein [Halococcoides cellulosivorans]AWB26341.1 hypothetical protein HARCEL1_00690 [Halococcoides cellulosivorans]